MFMSYSTLHEGGAMPQGDCETSGTRNGASCGESGLGAGRKPCCRRRGGGGGALVEPAVLAALLHAGGYGYDMRKIILEKTDGHVDVDVGGLYRSLRRLEEAGAVVSRWCDEESGPRRREYELTRIGVEMAEQWLEALRDRQRLDELLVGLLESGLEEADRSVSASDDADRSSIASKKEGTDE